MRRALVRKKNDTSAIWGDLARVDYLDTDSRMRRGLSRFAFAALSIVLILAIAVIGLLYSTLSSRQPNVVSVMDKARHSLVEVECKDWYGSGVVVDIQVPDTYKSAIFSAAHVFEDCAEGDTVVVTHEGVTYDGKLVKKDPVTGKVSNDTNDLALIYVYSDLPALKPAPEARIGDWAMALGNPWSYTDYMSLGIISNSDQDSYTTDTEINSGNSGGPLVDSKGRVLGILVSTPMKVDLFEDNPKGIWDTADGISRAVRLREACPVLLSDQGDCPFTN